MSPTIVVDVANVMGARPDGWWRDRAGAARRLRARISELAARGVAVPELPEGPAGARAGWQQQATADGVLHPRWVLVLEGRARAAAEPPAAEQAAAPEPAEGGDPPRVSVVSAGGPGDDEIVRQAALWAAGAPCLVVTADRELRRRCEAVGAHVTGPGWLINLL